MRSSKALLFPFAITVLLAVGFREVSSHGAPDDMTLDSNDGDTEIESGLSSTSHTIPILPDVSATSTKPRKIVTSTPKPKVTSTIASAAAASKSKSKSYRAEPVPEGTYDSDCNRTSDCLPNKNLECLRGFCLCVDPEVFDVREQRCTIPLGKQCDSDIPSNKVNCPEFAECFMDRCVCKTGYSMHTMTRCKSDYSDVGEPAETKTKTVLWPKHASKEETTDDKASCTPESCEQSKGLQCQVDGACKCKDPKSLFIEEFGRCLSSRLQKTLKDALTMMSSSEEDIKSFVKLLERFEEGDQSAGASEQYSRPIHQLIELLGENKSEESEAPPPARSRLAPPKSFRHGDLYAAAQEPVTEATAPSDADGEGSSGEPAPSSPPRQDPIPIKEQQPLTYGMDSRESEGEHYQLPLDNIQPQSQEPAIVQRQAPSYRQGQGGHGGHSPQQQHGEGIPLHGYGVIPDGTGTNHYRVPYGYGHGGHGGYGYPGGFHHGPGHYGPYGPFSYGGLGHGGPLHHGHHRPAPHHDPHHGVEPHHPRPRRPTVFTEMAEILGRSFKLVEKFLPLIYLINDALKKEGILHKSGGLVDGHREHRENHKGELIKEGAMIAGFAKLLGLLVRLKKRLDLFGGAEGLKKLLV